MRGRRSGERSRADAKTHLLARRLRVLASSAGHPGGFGPALGYYGPCARSSLDGNGANAVFRKRGPEPKNAAAERREARRARVMGPVISGDPEIGPTATRTTGCGASAPAPVGALLPSFFCGSGERQWAPPLPKRAAERWLHTGHSGAGRSREPGIHKHRTGEWNAGGATRRGL